MQMWLTLRPLKAQSHRVAMIGHCERIVVKTTHMTVSKVHNIPTGCRGCIVEKRRAMLDIMFVLLLFFLVQNANTAKYGVELVEQRTSVFINDASAIFL